MTDTPTADSPEAAAAAAGLLALADEAWTAILATTPLYATALGDRRFLDALTPNGADAEASQSRQFHDLIDRVRAIDTDRLAPADRVTHAALLDELDHRVGLVDSGTFRWAVDPLDGPQVEFLNVASYQPLLTEEDGEALLARWAAMGPWIDRHVEGLRAAAAGEGIVAPRALVDSVADELDDLLGTPDGDWTLASPAAEAPTSWPSSARDVFAAGVAAAIRDSIRPAFERQ